MKKSKVKSQKSKVESGQILVIVLLVMVVGLTIGLFLLGRTTTDISLTTKITDSSRAFNAAEAGIEQALRAHTDVTYGIPINYGSGLTYTLTPPVPVGAGSTYNSLSTVNTSEIFPVWLAQHRTDGSLDTDTVYYNNNILYLCYVYSLPTAIAVTLYYKDTIDSNKIKSSSVAFADTGMTQVSNAYTSSTSPSNCATSIYNREAQIRFNNTFGTNLNSNNYILLAVGIRPLVNGSLIGVVGQGGGLPGQGFSLDSLGQAAGTARKINIQKSYPAPPPFMNYVLYSTGTGNALTHTSN